MLRDSTATKKSCNPYYLTNPFDCTAVCFLGVPAPPSGTSVSSNFFVFSFWLRGFWWGSVSRIIRLLFCSCLLSYYMWISLSTFCDQIFPLFIVLTFQKKKVRDTKTNLQKTSPHMGGGYEFLDCITIMFI